MLRLEGDLAESPVIVCADSQTELTRLAGGAGGHTTSLGAAVWRPVLAISEEGRRVYLQWAPAHCGLPENDKADVLANEASNLP